MTDIATAIPADPAPRAVEGEALCPECGYDLHGLPQDAGRCPECGLDIHWDAARESRVPWVHRQRIGVLKSYARTVLLVTLFPRRYVAEVVRPSRRGAGLWFWAITNLLIAAPLVAIAVLGWEFDPELVNVAAMEIAAGTPSLKGWVVPAMFGAESGAVRVVCVLLWLGLATRVGAVFLRARGLDPGRGQQGVFLSYYACAPLLALPVLAVGYIVLAMMQPMANYINFLVFAAICVAMTVAVIHWWWVQALLVQRTTGSVGCAVTAGVLLPVAWLLVAVPVLAIPWLIGVVRIYCHAFR